MTTPSGPRSTRGRSSRRWKALCAQVHARRLPCIRCGQPIDYTLPYLNTLTGRPDPEAKSVDHYPHPLESPRGQELAEDLSNLWSAHLKCNQSAGNRVSDTIEPPQTTEQW